MKPIFFELVAFWKKNNGWGFMLLELILVVVIIGILTAISIPTFLQWREKAITKEAAATLKILQAAQKGYHMDKGFYFNSANHQAINPALKVQLPYSVKRNWDYAVKSSGCVQAMRRSNPSVVIYHLKINDVDLQNGPCVD